MLFAGIMIDSLMIDRLKKKWVVRLLFLLVFAISVCSSLWPMGDPDLTKIISWMQSVGSNPASMTAGNIVLPIITTGNVVYFFFTFAIMFVDILLSILYSRLYVGEKNGQGVSQSLLAFFRRLPLLIVFYIILLIPSFFLAGIFQIGFVFVIPVLYFAPILITFENFSPIKAITLSYKYTKGAKISIALNVLLLISMYWFAESLFLMFLPEASNAGILLQGFFTAYFVLAYGRLNGAFYERLRLVREGTTVMPPTEGNDL